MQSLIHDDLTVIIPLYNKSETIEHIIPENDTKLNISEQTHAHCKNKLGNLTILYHNDNSKASNKKFTNKRKLYKDCDIQMTINIAKNNTKWNKNTIDDRTKTLSKFFINRWPKSVTV